MPPQLSAQTRSPEPIALARTMFEAVQLGDWQTVIRFAHPDALAGFRKEQLEMVHYLIRQGLEDPSGPKGGSRRSFAGRYMEDVMLVASEAELTALPPDTLLARYLQYSYREWKSKPHDSTGYERKYIGQVMEGDSVAYVLTQIRQNGKAIAEVDVLTLKRISTGAWRSFLNGGLGVSGAGSAFSFIGDDQ